MAAIPAPILPRVASLLRMLGSDQDGEALGAARALRRTLGGVGLDLHTLADVVEHPVVVMVERPEPVVQPRRSRASSPGRVELGPARRRQVIDALSRASARDALSSWEAEFVASVIVILRGPRPRLSSRQIEIVERLLSKFGEGEAWA